MNEIAATARVAGDRRSIGGMPMFRSCLLAGLLAATMAVAQYSTTTTTTGPVGQRLPLSSAGLAPAVRASSLDVLAANPALRTPSAGWTAGASLQGHRWSGPFGMDDRRLGLPEEFSVQYGGARVALQAGWKRHYDFRYENDLIVTTPEQPEGNGEILDYGFSSQVQVADLGVSGELPLAGGDQGVLRAGLRLEQAWLRHDEGVDRTLSDGTSTKNRHSDRDVRPVIGLAWELETPDGTGWSLGAVWSDDVRMDWLRGYTYFRTVLPATLELGAALRLADGGRLELQATRADWSSAVGRGDNGVDWSASWSQPLRAGLRGLVGFTTDGDHATTSAHAEDAFDSVFLVLGAEWSPGATVLGLVVADNRLSNAEWNKRTVVKLSASRSFGH